MKIKVIILYLFIPCMALSQTSNTSVLDTINYIDGNGLRQGKWIEKEGNLRRIGNFINNKKQGIFIIYEGKDKIREMEYKNDKLSGKWVSYIGESIDEEFTYFNDTLNGEAKSYYFNGKIHKKGFYKNGKQHGMKYQYYKSGKLKMETLWDNGEEVWSKFYFKNGKINIDIIYPPEYINCKYNKKSIPIYKFTNTEEIYYDKKGNIKDIIKLKPDNKLGYDTIISPVYLNKSSKMKKSNRYRVVPFYDGEVCDTLKEFYKSGKLYLEKYHETKQKTVTKRYRKNGSLKYTIVEDKQTQNMRITEYRKNGQVKNSIAYNLRYFENF